MPTVLEDALAGVQVTGYHSPSATLAALAADMLRTLHAPKHPALALYERRFETITVEEIDRILPEEA